MLQRQMVTPGLTYAPPAAPFTTPEAYPAFREALPTTETAQGRYRVRFAKSSDDLDAVLRLRFDVFNLELGEGMDASFETGRDEDAFDPLCHHLMVEEAATGRLVGTYRMMTSSMAARGRGFYSAGEFYLGLLPDAVLDQAIEVGRACIHADFRNRQTLYLLWKGLASYMTWNRKRYLFGCCSLTSQDPAVGIGALARLAADGAVDRDLRVVPLPGLECRLTPADAMPAGETRLPILFRTYLRHGAKVLGPPAIDRDFKTIDFFTCLDVASMAPEHRRLFFS
ncbi:MAG: GNAT family N-acetyltransferase [Acidobacteria bacterium]|nr:GNAT family N-acetyltransferase [Acidobacteriota bacterium]